MSRRFRTSLLVTLALTTLATVAMAQREAPSPEVSFVVALGHDVPRVYAVEGFLDFAYESLVASRMSFELSVLRPLGIEDDEVASTRVEQAVLIGRAVLTESLDLTPHLDDPATFDRLQERFRNNRVRTIASLYRDLLDELEHLGVAPANVEGFIDEAIVPSLAVWGDEEAKRTGSDVLAQVEALYQQVFHGKDGVR